MTSADLARLRELAENCPPSEWYAAMSAIEHYPHFDDHRAWSYAGAVPPHHIVAIIDNFAALEREVGELRTRQRLVEGGERE